MSLTIGSLFSGVGGLDLGLEMAIPGARIIWQCEREPFPRAVLEDRWPGVKLYRDVRDIDGGAARPDLICGGFPCQDVSVAGEGAGIEGETRSGLWWEFRRIVRILRPRFVFIENVYLGSSRWLPIVRRSLWKIGYPSLPLRVSAADVGAPHERARVFVLAYAHRQQLRQQQQRVPGGRPGGVRHPGQAQPGGDGQGRDVGHPHGLAGLESDGQGAALGERWPGPGQAPLGPGAGLQLAHPGGERLEKRPLRRGRGRSAPAGGGAALDVADGHGRGCEGIGLAQQGGQLGESGDLVHRRYPPGWQFPPGPAAIDGWDGPQPAVRRTHDGLSRWMVRARLAALGNAVVPHAAARAWLTLLPLVPA